MPSKPREKKKSAVNRVPAVETREIPLVGHARVLEQLSEAITKGRLGHAFLFVGPDGVGKHRLARHIAQSLLCERSDVRKLQPCGQCSSCAMVRAGTHPDLLQVAKPEEKSELPIAMIQALTAQLSLKPARGSRKIAIVNNADDLNEESANAFLKTLEEPPPGSLLILIARSLESQLPTIQSRCQVARFFLLSDDEVARILLDLGKVGSAEQARLWAHAAQGSVAKAIEWAKPEWQELVETMVESLAQQPITSHQLTARLLPFIDEAGKESASKRERARLVVERLLGLLREALRASCGSFDSGEPGIPAGRLDVDLLADMIERTLDTDYHLQRMAAIPLSIETWLDDLARLDEGRHLDPIF
ncbi:DNA polymerase III subunit delta' [bacterium]|nr:DNA polymerase III subunit delta' [bacterium]